MLALLTVVVVSFSPTMTAAVVADSGARGRLSDAVLAMVVLADLVLLIVFAVTMQVARVVFDGGGWQGAEVLSRLAWEIGGAVAFGVLVGVMFALYLRYIGREITLVLLAVCAVLSQVGRTQQLQPLLAAVAAGIVIENLAVAQGDTLRAAVRRGAPPVLVVFFVAVGASLRLDALAAIGMSALALSAVRLGFIRLGAVAGVKVSGLPGPIRKYAWTGLVSQAGITLGFASVIAAEFPGWGNQLQLLLVASIALHELVGPILFRRGLARAGELDARTPRPLVVVSNREPYIHNRAEDGRIAVSAATGGVAVALDALMRERGGVWIAHGAGSADRLVVDAADKVAVPPDNPIVRAAPPVARGAGVLRLLRRLCERGPVAAVPRRRRPPEVSQRRLGGLPGHQRAVRRGDRFGARRHGVAGLHPGLPPGAGRAGVARAAARHADGAVLAHPVAVSRSAAHLPVAALNSLPGCWPTTCWPSRSSATVATSCWPPRRNWTPRWNSSRRACATRAAPRPWCRCRLASTTIASRGLPPTPALAKEQERLTDAARPARGDHWPRRGPPRLHQGHSRAAERHRRADGAAAGPARAA